MAPARLAGSNSAKTNASGLSTSGLHLTTPSQCARTFTAATCRPFTRKRSSLCLRNFLQVLTLKTGPKFGLAAAKWTSTTSIGAMGLCSTIRIGNTASQVFQPKSALKCRGETVAGTTLTVALSAQFYANAKFQADMLRSQTCTSQQLVWTRRIVQQAANLTRQIAAAQQHF